MQMVRALIMVWSKEPFIPIETEILKQDSTNIKLSLGLRVIGVWEEFPSFKREPATIPCKCRPIHRIGEVIQHLVDHHRGYWYPGYSKLPHHNE